MMHIANDIERLAFAAFCAGFHPDDVANGNAAKKWLEWDEDRRSAYRKARAVLKEIQSLDQTSYEADLVLDTILAQPDWHPPARSPKGEGRMDLRYDEVEVHTTSPFDLHAGAPSAMNPMGKDRPLQPDEIWTEWHGGLCPVPLATLVDVEVDGAGADGGSVKHAHFCIPAAHIVWKKRSPDQKFQVIRWRRHSPDRVEALEPEPVINDLMRGMVATVVHDIRAGVDGWEIWRGGNMPIAIRSPNQHVDVLFRSGCLLLDRPAGRVQWLHDDHMMGPLRIDDVVMWRITDDGQRRACRRALGPVSHNRGWPIPIYPV